MVGAPIIAGLGVIYSLIMAGRDIAAAASTGSPLTSALFTVLDLVFSVCAFVLLIVGIRKLIASYLIMQLVIQALSIATCAVMALVFFVILVAPEQTARGVLHDMKSAFPSYVNYSENDSVTLVGGVSFFVFTLLSLVQVWFFVIIFRAFQYIKEKVRAAEMLTTVWGREGLGQKREEKTHNKFDVSGKN